MKNNHEIIIISGGQTGVDRAALDAAMESGSKAGGWCPEGRMAEDGVISAHYPVTELPGAGYRQRTERNVLDSDGTVIIYFDTAYGGTEETILFCVAAKKPCVQIDAEKIPGRDAVKIVRKFINKYSIVTLNVAGPRASEEARAYGYSKRLIDNLLKKNSGQVV